MVDNAILRLFDIVCVHGFTWLTDLGAFMSTPAGDAYVEFTHPAIAHDVRAGHQFHHMSLMDGDVLAEEQFDHTLHCAHGIMVGLAQVLCYPVLW